MKRVQFDTIYRTVVKYQAVTEKKHACCPGWTYHTPKQTHSCSQGYLIMLMYFISIINQKVCFTSGWGQLCAPKDARMVARVSGQTSASALPVTPVRPAKMVCVTIYIWRA